MGPGGGWPQRAVRVSVIAACTLALAGWAAAFPDVAFHGLESTRPAATKQPREPASVAIVHLRGVSISIRNESPRSKHASGSQVSGVAAAAAAIVAAGKSGRIDLQSQKPRKVKTPAKPPSTPSPKPARQPAKVSPPATTTSPTATEPSPAEPTDNSVKEQVDTSPGAADSNSGESRSDQNKQDRSKRHYGDQVNRRDRNRQRDRQPDCSRRAGRGDRSGGRR